AAEALQRAGEFKENPARRWTLAWLWSSVFQREGQFESAEKQLRSILDFRDGQRGLDFSRDYLVINELGLVLFEKAKVAAASEKEEIRHTADELRRKAVEAFQRTLALDPENLAAHYNLFLLYSLLGQGERAAEHQKLHAKYKPDENAREKALTVHRQKNPPANHAATAGAI